MAKVIYVDFIKKIRKVRNPLNRSLLQKVYRLLKRR